MDEQEMLDFVKALSHTDRLRIVGLLSIKPRRAGEIAEAMKLPLPETIKHLNHLQHGNIVIRSADETYSLDEKGMESLARSALEGTRAAYLPDSTMKEDARKVLAAHLNLDGSIKMIPAQPGRIKVILDYIINAFEPGKNYREREVNLLLARFNKDTSTLRRYLVDAGMLERERDGSRYWRPG
jgi:hypothetical protein